MKSTKFLWITIIFIFLLLGCRDDDSSDPSIDVSEFAYANTVIRVISPAFGELWKPGTEHQIRWFATEDVKTVEIQLYRKNEFQFTIVTNTVENSVNWKVPSDLKHSHHYRMKVINVDLPEQNITSKDFFILP